MSIESGPTGPLVTQPPQLGSQPGRTLAEQVAKTWAQRAWMALGATSIAIGVINAFLPLLPTTIFLLIGVWAYSKGDPETRDRLLNHPHFGHPLRLWVEHRQITRLSKLAACASMLFSAGCMVFFMGLTALTGGVSAGLLGLCVYLATRAEPSPEPRDKR